MSPVLRLMATLGATNLAFWLMWPASVVRVELQGWGEVLTGLFGSAAWLAAIGALVLVPVLTRRAGFQATTTISCGLVLAGALGIGIAAGGLQEWLWTVLLGVGFGLRWGAVDAWLADTAEPHARGRVLSIGETIASGTAALGPAMAALVAPAYGMSALGLLAASLALAGLIACRGAAEPVPVPRAVETAAARSARVRGVSGVATLIVLVSAGCGGVFESGFTAAASLLALADGASERLALIAAAAVGLGSFPAQYLLGRWADLRGGSVVLLLCAVALVAAMLSLSVWPRALIPVSLLVGAAGGGLYTVAVIFGLQASGSAAAGSAALISSAAIAYSAGSVLSPSITGASLALFGVGGTLLGFAALAVGLLGVLAGVGGWRLGIQILAPRSFPDAGERTGAVVSPQPLGETLDGRE